jgi:hypothetical protein
MQAQIKLWHPCTWPLAPGPADVVQHVRRWYRADKGSRSNRRKMYGKQESDRMDGV